MSFDKKLKTLRLENNMTQESLARRINVERSPDMKRKTASLLTRS